MTHELPDRQHDQMSMHQRMDHELAELRDFVSLAPTQKFRLLMQTIEFLQAIDRALPGMEKRRRLGPEGGKSQGDH